MWKTKQKYLDYYKKYRQEHKSELNRKKKLETQNLRTKILNNYGRVCTCCGITNEVFLTIDHVNGGGRKHRRKTNYNNQQIYREIIRNNYPVDYQILCMNCNWGKFKCGICPHKENVNETNNFDICYNRIR